MYGASRHVPSRRQKERISITVQESRKLRLFKKIKQWLEHRLQRQLTHSDVVYFLMRVFVKCIRDKECRKKIILDTIETFKEIMK